MVAEVGVANAAVPGPLTLLHANVMGLGPPSSAPEPRRLSTSPTSATVSGPASAAGGRLPMLGSAAATS